MASKKYLDYEGLTELVAKIKETFGPKGSIVFKGSVATVSTLPTVADAEVGDMYTIQAAGTTTADFVDGAGKEIAANSEVAAVNVADAGDPAEMKWVALGSVLDVSNKLTFGDTLPADPADGDTFLYLGNTSYKYTSVTPEGTENPSEEGWYEENSGTYTLTTDSTVDASKTYYTRAEDKVKGVIYVWNDSGSEWVSQSSGDIMTPITVAEVDALFA